ncbi:YbhB/YbcL family Raf kinase inhibitor-like protein [Candidatus Woesearchaeota archaeon]|nr:YbhB/YbcL family Raf kinase inhibitor-like protein [Candidatus Woesearchaeota archaeon]
MGNLKLTSPVFENNGNIPAKYTCQGDDVNPELSIEGIPGGTKSLVLIVDDPDAPMGTWDHWVVWNIKPTDKIKENSVPGVQGMNDFGKHDYGGPCPPSGTHRYMFKLYALDTELDIDESAHKKDVEKAMEGHILAKTQLIGLYQKS